MHFLFFDNYNIYKLTIGKFPQLLHWNSLSFTTPSSIFSRWKNIFSEKSGYIVFRFVRGKAYDASNMIRIQFQS